MSDTMVRRRSAGRLPAPVVTARDDGRHDLACLGCPVQLRGLPSRGAALSWAEWHRCDPDTATTTQKPWPSGRGLR